MDDAAFDAFYDRTAPDVARHVYLLTASPHRAAHVTHKAYARAYTNWAVVSQLPQPESWVRMVAADLALDPLHRAQHKVGGWIPHSDRISQTVCRTFAAAPSEPAASAATEPPETPEASEPPEAPEAPKAADASASEPAPAPEPAPKPKPEPEPESEADSDADPESGGPAKKARDNRSKKKGRKSRVVRPTESANRPTATPTTTPTVTYTPVPDLSSAKGRADKLSPSADIAMLRALRRLPAHRRRVMVLRHHLGLAPEDIAAEIEATTSSTVDRIETANHQLSRRVGELTGMHPDGPEAHERISEVMNDLTRRYKPKLHSAHMVRTGARVRTGLLVVVVAAATAGLGTFTVTAITDPGGLPDKRAEAKASIKAREAAGIPMGVTQAPTAEVKLGRTNAKAAQIPDGQRELVHLKGTTNRDGGTFLTVDRARLGDGPESRPPVRDVPLAPDVRIRGEQAFGLTEEKGIDIQDFLARVANGSLAKAAFELHYNDDDQVVRITEYNR